MPTSLPVPSKAALRHLRNLALGTSCTVAFSAGLLTEDRRRRIHTAREVQGNAKKLKSSRHYHSTGAASLQSFEELVLKNHEDALWLPSNVARHRSSASLRSSEEPSVITNPTPPHLPFNDTDHFAPAIPSNNASPLPPPISTHYSSRPFKVPSFIWPASDEAGSLSIRYPTRRTATVNEPPKQEVYNRQNKLASDVDKLLADGESSLNLHAASLRFLEAFEEDMGIADTGMLPVLVESAVKISEGCFIKQRFDMVEKILLIVSSKGPVDEQFFLKLNPAFVLKGMIDAEMNDEMQWDNLERLETAASVFLTPFPKKSEGHFSQDMIECGNLLCTATHNAGMHELALKIYSRLSRQKLEMGSLPVALLIKSTHSIGRHDMIYRHFTKFYSQTTPTQQEFNTIVKLVFDSVLIRRNQIDKAEGVLVEASRLAQANNLSFDTIRWLLNLLDHDWKVNHNLTRIRATFDRLVPQLFVDGCPATVYRRIIQYSAQSGDEAATSFYHKALVELDPGSRTDVRVQGHLTLLSAVQKDWDTVRERLQAMTECPRQDSQNYLTTFLPILDLFACSHHISETEQLMQSFLDGCELQPDTSLFNTMVNIYCKAQEIDSLIRWIEHVASLGLLPDNFTINTIFSNCYRTWHWRFGSILMLYRRIRRLPAEKLPSGVLIDDSTLAVIHSIAISAAGNDTEALRVNLDKLHHVSTCGNFPQASSNPTKPSQPRRVSTHRAPRESSGIIQLYSERKFVDAVRVCQEALYDGVNLHSRDLRFAVKASLKLGSVEDARSMMRTAHKAGQNIYTSMNTLLMYEMDLVVSNGEPPEAVMKILQNAFVSHKQRRRKFSPVLTTHALNILNNQGRSDLAVKLWASVSASSDDSRQLPDLPCLTVLLRSYIQLCHTRGILWVMKVLCTSKIVPDEKFKRILKEGCKHARILSNQAQRKTGNRHKVEPFLDALVQALQAVSKAREFAEDDKLYLRRTTMAIAMRKPNIQPYNRESMRQMQSASDSQARTRLPRIGHQHNVSQANPHPEEALHHSSSGPESFAISFSMS